MTYQIAAQITRGNSDSPPNGRAAMDNVLKLLGDAGYDVSLLLEQDT